MGSVTPAPPKPLLAALRHKADIRVFVETGTAAGDTAELAGDVFDTVITLEADTALYEAAHERHGHQPERQPARLQSADR